MITFIKIKTWILRFTLLASYLCPVPTDYMQASLVVRGGRIRSIKKIEKPVNLRH